MEGLLTPRCPVCEQDTVSPEPFFYDWKSRRFWIYRCGHCTHQFVYPPVTRDDQALIYGDRYFSKEGDWVCGIFQAGYKEAEAQLKEEARQILDMLPLSTGRLLDIGCAGGVFLSEARARGFDVFGIELNASMAAYARNTYQVDVLNLGIEDVAGHRWSRHFDVVTILDCLEHLPEPLGAMKKVAQWLRPGGFVFIRGPFSNSPIARFKERIRRVVRIKKRLPGYPLDANAFNKRSFGELLDLSGFQSVTWIGEAPSFTNLLARRNPQA